MVEKAVEKPLILYLSPKEREKARVVAKDIWKEGMMRLAGKEERMIDTYSADNLYKTAAIRKKSPYGQSDSDLTIEWETHSLVKITEVFSFNRGLGGHVVKWTIDPARPDLAIKHEANEEELKELLEAMSKSVTKKEAPVPRMTREALEDAQKLLVPIHLDCMRILGNKASLQLTFKGKKQHSIIGIQGKQRIQDNSKDGDADLVIMRWVKKPCAENPAGNGLTEEKYVFRRIYYDGGNVMQGDEEMGSIELNSLWDEIKESDQYKEVSGNNLDRSPLLPRP